MEKAQKYCLENLGVTTQRQWRRYKRRQLMNLCKAIEELRLGCDYCPWPSGVSIAALDDMIDALKQAWSPKEWGA